MSLSNTNTNSALYAVVGVDGYDMDLVEDCGGPCVAFFAATSGDIVVEFLNGDQCILPACPNGYPYNIQAKAIMLSDANTTASGVVALFNRLVDIKAEAYVQSPADGYDFEESSLPAIFSAYLIRPEYVSKIELWTEDGYIGDMTISENTASYSYWPGIETFTDKEWWVVIVDAKGRSYKSKNTFTFSSTG